MVTRVFANLARTAARARGIDEIPMLVLPHPMEGRPAAEIERIADGVFEEAIRLLAERSS